MVCCPRFGGGDRHQRPPTAILRAETRARLVPVAALAALALGARRLRRRQAAPGRRRALRRLPGRRRPRPSSPPTSGSPRPTTSQLEIENTGDEQVPDLAVTIFTGDEKASGSFSVRSDQPGLADPEPAGVDPRERLPEARHARARRAPSSTRRPPGGAEAAQTNTFSFGPLDARREHGHRLAGDAGRRRHLHRPLRARRRAQRQGEGGDRRRRPGGGRVRGHDQRQAAARHGSTTPATWSPAGTEPRLGRAPAVRARSVDRSRAWRRCGSARRPPGCGGEEPTTTTEPQDDHRLGHDRDHDDEPRRHRRAARRRSATATAGCELAELGDFDQPVYVDPAALGRRRAPLRGRAVRPDPARAARRRRAERVPRRRRPGHLRRRAGPALGRLRTPTTSARGCSTSTTPTSSGDSRTVEYRRSESDAALADPDSARELLHIEDFASNHNGGLLLFGPDVELYLGMGDGGGAGDPERTAQNPDSPLGKLLRIDRDEPGRLRARRDRPAQPVAVSRSTGAPTSSGSATSGQDTFEEIDAAPARRPRPGAQLRLVGVRGHRSASTTTSRRRTRGRRCSSTAATAAAR